MKNKPYNWSARLPATLVTTVVVAILAVIGTFTAHAQSAYGHIANETTNLCLQPLGASTAAGAAIVQQPCSAGAGDAQLWALAPAKGIYVHYVNKLSGMCLDARGGPQNHTPVQQWPCNGISNEYWVYNPAYWGKSSPVSIYSGVAGSYGSRSQFCLDVPGAQNTPGLPLQIYQCNYTLAQQWY